MSLFVIGVTREGLQPDSGSSRTLPLPSCCFHRGTAEVAVDDDAFAKCEALMDRLLELDDVDNVFTNAEGLH